jgi:protease I
MTSSEHDRELSGRHVAILATHGYEQSELAKPLEAIREAGAQADVISLPSSQNTIRGWSKRKWADDVEVQGTVDDRSSDDYDALVLPGGVMNPDALRMHPEAVSFVRGFFQAGKPVAAICHGPWMIVEAGAADGRTMTSYPSIRTDLENAGARWVDEEVVVDQGLVTSRRPSDLEAFIDKTIEEISEGVHAGQHA